MSENGRGTNGRFLNGNAGGPGRPPGGSRQVQRLRAAIQAAIEPDVAGGIARRLAQIALSSTNERAAVAAAVALWDRLLGRPAATIELTGEVGVDPAAAVEAREDLAALVAEDPDLRARVVGDLLGRLRERGDAPQTPPYPG